MNLPNKLTVLRMVLIPFFVLAMMWDALPYHYFLGLLLFVIASLTDMLDGKIARKYNLITDFGKFMDPLADKLLVTAAMVLFVELRAAAGWVVVLILAREFLVTSLRTLAAGKGVVIAADKWGKFKTVSQMLWIILGILLLACSQDLHLEGPLMDIGGLLFTLLTLIVVALTLFSGWNYMWHNREVYADK